jgi:hypothetical protein
MAFLTGWSYRKKITIDETKVDADLTDFPVLVKLTSSNFDFSKARSDGYDIRFTSSDGTTLLKYERERHDATNQVAEYWVKVPSVSGSANTDFYIYFGNSSASDGADPTNVWDTNFHTVYHLGESASPSQDSTITNQDLTWVNTPTQIDGKIGKGLDFDEDDRLETSSIYPTTALTLEAWFKCDAKLSNYDVIIGEAIQHDYSLHIRDDASVTRILRGWVVNTDGTDGTCEGANNSAPLNTWIYAVLTYDGSYVRLYKDGVEIASAPLTGNIRQDGGNFQIASGASGYRDFDGIIDEVRFSFNARSAAWIKASYNSGNNSLVSYGSEEASYQPRGTSLGEPAIY